MGTVGTPVSVVGTTAAAAPGGTGTGTGKEKRGDDGTGNGALAEVRAVGAVAMDVAVDRRGEKGDANSAAVGSPEKSGNSDGGNPTVASSLLMPGVSSSTEKVVRATTGVVPENVPQPYRHGDAATGGGKTAAAGAGGEMDPAGTAVAMSVDEPKEGAAVVVMGAGDGGGGGSTSMSAKKMKPVPTRFGGRNRTP